jgi:hypothetical protein
MKPVPILDLLYNEHTSLSVSDVDRDVIRKLLDSIFNILPVFTLRWKTQTFLHSEFLAQVCLHKIWRTLVRKADWVYLEERQTKICVVTLIKLLQKGSNTHLNTDDDKLIIFNPSERYQSDTTISGTTGSADVILRPCFFTCPLKIVLAWAGGWMK